MNLAHKHVIYHKSAHKQVALGRCLLMGHLSGTIVGPRRVKSHWRIDQRCQHPRNINFWTVSMRHWKRTLVPNGFVWTNRQTRAHLLLRLKDGRWTATLAVLLASGKMKKTRFFAEDGYDASLQKCLLYAWRALHLDDRATFDVAESLADLRRFVP